MDNNKQKKLEVQAFLDERKYLAPGQKDWIYEFLMKSDRMSDSQKLEGIQEFLDRNIQFLSPNEPVTPYGIQRVLEQMDVATHLMEQTVGAGRKTITMWSPNVRYDRNDIVLYFKQENRQIDPNVGKREFVFILISTKDGNESVPNYDMVNGIPDFTKTNWSLLNPMSYLLQDLVGMKEVVKNVFNTLMLEHIKKEHNLIGSQNIEHNLVRKDYSNLLTYNRPGKFTVSILNSTYGDSNRIKMDSNGIMEYFITYSFDTQANPLNKEITIDDKRYYYQSSPIWDESDKTIFAKKYTEDDMFNVTVNRRKVLTLNESTNVTVQSNLKTEFTNLRYGTNIFHATIEFPTPFVNDEYCVFFDTYGNGEFVFGYDAADLEAKTEPTYDAIVSMPMLYNKKPDRFEVVLPIHTYFNSIQKYNIGVPWNNLFRLQVIGRFR